MIDYFSINSFIFWVYSKSLKFAFLECLAKLAGISTVFCLEWLESQFCDVLFDFFPLSADFRKRREKLL